MLPHKMPDNLRLTKLGNTTRISKFGEHTAWCAVALQKKFLPIAIKNCKKVDNEVFLSSSLLLKFSTFGHIFFSRIVVLLKFLWKKAVV